MCNLQADKNTFYITTFLYGYQAFTSTHQVLEKTFHRDCGTSSHPFGITPRRRYPIQQAPYSRVLPTLRWNGGHGKRVLSPGNSRVVCRPWTVRIAPPGSNLARLPIAAQFPKAPDPWSKEAVLLALECWKRKKRTVEEEEDQTSAAGQEDKRRCGPLKSSLSSQSSDGELHERPSTSAVSCLKGTCTCGIHMSSRNAISSSYSSTRGISQLWKRRRPSASPFSSPASSRSQTPERPEKKTREEDVSQEAGSSALPVDKESQGEQVADTTTCREQNSCDSAATPSTSRPRRRKFQLVPSRKGIPLILPPAPKLAGPITVEEYYQEGQDRLRWLMSVFEDKAGKEYVLISHSRDGSRWFSFGLSPLRNPPLGFSVDSEHKTASSSITESPPATPPASTLAVPAAWTAASSASPPAPLTNPQFLKNNIFLKNLNPLGLPSFPVCIFLPDSHPQCPFAPDDTRSSGPSWLFTARVPPQPSSDSRSTETFSGLTPASPAIPACDATKSPLASQAETSAKPQAPPAPGPTLKPSVPFRTPSSPPANPSASAALAVSSAHPMFKPIFVAPPRSGNEGPVPFSRSHVATVASSSSVPTPTTSSLPTFSPVFSSTGLPTSLPLSTPFSFSQNTSGTSTNAPLFPGQASVSVPSAAAWGTTTGTAADSTQKPVFGFGASSVTSTASSMTSSTASTAQPVLFGAPLAPGASSTPAMGSILQFGKALATPAPTTAMTFGQSLPGAVQTAAGSSTASFGGFGGTLTTFTPVAPSQPALTFSSTATPAFNIPFGSGTRPPIPSYPGVTPQPMFGATDRQQMGAAKPALAPSFGSSVPFGRSAALHVSSFFAATTSGFGATTQTNSSGTSSSVFGSIPSSPFMSGLLAGPAGSGGFGMSVPAPHSISTTGVFGFGAGQSGSTGSTAPFLGGLSQNSLAAAGQSTPFPFHMAGTPQNMSVFAGTSTPTFGQNTPAPVLGTSGSSLSSGASSAPAQGFAGPGTSATTSGFGATTQTNSSGTSSSVFGSIPSSPFMSGLLAGPAGSGGFGMSVPAPHSISTTGVFGFGAGQSGSTGSTAPFLGGLSQNSLAAAGQSTPFPFHVAGTPQNMSVFAGTSTPTFGQNTPAPVLGTSGSSLSSGASSAPAQGFAGPGTSAQKSCPPSRPAGLPASLSPRFGPRLGFPSRPPAPWSDVVSFLEARLAVSDGCGSPPGGEAPCVAGRLLTLRGLPRGGGATGQGPAASLNAQNRSPGAPTVPGCTFRGGGRSWAAGGAGRGGARCLQACLELRGGSGGSGGARRRHRPG
ncbi:LOW QUALITY PROTEIN: putative nuclear envelope pore membrane protein POM 121B [Manis pentadactyla]|uniref:LOW QUALITY PROTEIN: putative nuclear envelope pore membrane protein POM 121B n=1 Tax=Manis pentadactyla TaxID=143292 RepID=UPI00255C8AE9|nr:LOW QUALITY PROTEIN: putative nuclear envelope pore membrane protein POM 121B [Manis pentadactyla]